MWWNGPPMWGWGMVFPFFGLLCMVFVVFFMFRMFSGRGCFMRGHNNEIDELKREVKDLKGEIENLKKKE